MPQFILAIDQGTTGSTVLLIDRELQVRAKTKQEYPQIYPQPGWVEHNPNDIWTSVLGAIDLVLREAKADPKEIAAIGITNQRETTTLWEGKEATPVHNAIVWQCRRTADLCEKLKRDGYEKLFRERTGLVLDPYFSGTKIAWLLEHVAGVRKKAKEGKIRFGTIDTFLVYKLTGGEVHVTDVSNASRTLLLNLKTLAWDPELLKILDIPETLLPDIKPNSHVYGYTKGVSGLPDGIPIAGMAGDQQAALFGQACFQPGEAKCTYGTGAFLLINTGSRIIHSERGMLTSVAWKIGSEVNYLLEGATFIAGAAVQWLRDGLKIIQKSSEIEPLAREVSDNGGITFVPALTGLGAPHWRAHARGVICGLTRATTRAHLARATLEGIALQISDLIESMEADFGQKISGLKVDGGACANELLMQFQADIIDRDLVRPKVIDTTAMGAAFLAGLATKFWPSREVITQGWRQDRRFHPSMKDAERKRHLKIWKEAVAKA